MSFGFWLYLACAVWVGVMAGFFFAFSFVVMPGLGAMEPLAALASMQAINLAVRNAVFALVFFGALILCIGVALHALIRRDAPAWRLALPAALIYLTGAFGVTTLFNVPLNAEIASLDPARPRKRRGDGLLHRGMDALEPPPHPREPRGFGSAAFEPAVWERMMGTDPCLRGEWFPNTGTTLSGSPARARKKLQDRRSIPPVRQNHPTPAPGPVSRRRLH